MFPCTDTGSCCYNSFNLKQMKHQFYVIVLRFEERRLLCHWSASAKGTWADLGAANNLMIYPVFLQADICFPRAGAPLANENPPELVGGGSQNILASHFFSEREASDLSGYIKGVTNNIVSC